MFQSSYSKYVFMCEEGLCQCRLRSTWAQNRLGLARKKERQHPKKPCYDRDWKQRIQHGKYSKPIYSKRKPRAPACSYFIKIEVDQEMRHETSLKSLQCGICVAEALHMIATCFESCIFFPWAKTRCEVERTRQGTRLANRLHNNLYK